MVVCTFGYHVYNFLLECLGPTRQLYPIDAIEAHRTVSCASRMDRTAYKILVSVIDSSDIHKASPRLLHAARNCVRPLGQLHQPRDRSTLQQKMYSLGNREKPVDSIHTIQ